jgi:hypothetical protein
LIKGNGREKNELGLVKFDAGNLFGAQRFDFGGLGNKKQTSCKKISNNSF